MDKVETLSRQGLEDLCSRGIIIDSSVHSPPYTSPVPSYTDNLVEIQSPLGITSFTSPIRSPAAKLAADRW